MQALQADFVAAPSAAGEPWTGPPKQLGQVRHRSGASQADHLWATSVDRGGPDAGRFPVGRFGQGVASSTSTGTPTDAP